jgi:hypothetical protein
VGQLRPRCRRPNHSDAARSTKVCFEEAALQRKWSWRTAAFGRKCLTDDASLAARRGTAAKVRYELILLKNNVLLAQKVERWTRRERLSYQALRVCCGAGKILASLRRFWAVAVSSPA